MADKIHGYGSGSGTTHAYAIEVRTSYPSPEIISSDFAITGEWQRLPIGKTFNPLGIPNGTWCFVAEHLDLLSYESAYALAAGFVTHCEIGGACIEFRLIEIELTYSYATTERGVGEPVKLSTLSREAKFLPRQETSASTESKP